VSKKELQKKVRGGRFKRGGARLGGTQPNVTETRRRPNRKRRPPAKKSLKKNAGQQNPSTKGETGVVKKKRGSLECAVTGNEKFFCTTNNRPKKVPGEKRTKQAKGFSVG